MMRWFCFECDEYFDECDTENSWDWEEFQGRRVRRESHSDICPKCNNYEIEEVAVCLKCHNAHCITGTDYCYQCLPVEDEMDREFIRKISAVIDPVVFMGKKP